MFRLFTKRALSGTENGAIRTSKAQSSPAVTFFRSFRRGNSSAACDASETPAAPNQATSEVHSPSAAHNCKGGVPKRWRLHDKIFAYICAAGTTKYSYVVQPFKEPLFEDLPKTHSQKILEVGVGPGTNFAYYKERIPDAQIFGLDPNPEMKIYFEKKAREYQFEDAEFVEAYGDGMPFPDKFFDCIVATHVLCSVPDVSKTLTEMHRVLKPQGRFLFFEHVVGPPGSFVRAVQTVLNPFQTRISGGCHLKRDILADIRSSSFHSIQAREFIVPKAGFCGPHVSGFAVV